MRTEVENEQRVQRLRDSVSRATSFMDAMDRMKFTPQQRYERLREQYATGKISLAQFDIAAAELLAEGL